MKQQADFEQMMASRHREVRVVTTLVIVALAGGVGLLWPSVQERVVARFGPFFPSRFLLGELLALVALFVVYLWRKAGQVEALVGHLLDERGRGHALAERLAQARSVLQASAQMQLDDEAGASLQKILQCVTEALTAQRGVLWRQRGEGRNPEREAVFPSTRHAPDPLALAFEDEIARKVLATSARLIIDGATDLKQLGIAAARPRDSAARLVAAPLLLEGKAAGVLLLCDPQLETTSPESPLDLLEVFAGFAAGVLRNLRLFQSVERHNNELERARHLLCDHQRELAEIDAATTMARLARSLAHGLSSPLTAIADYADVVMTAPPDALTLRAARDGLRGEIATLKKQLCDVVELTRTWRREWGIVDLNQVVETAVALHTEALRARGVSCRFEPFPSLPFTVADGMRLRQVFLSLLAFVRTVLKDGPGRELRVRTLPDQGILRVHIDFLGRPGIDQLWAPLLDPEVDVALLAEERSVELPVAVAILRDHRGNLEVKLREDGTTRLSVELPVLAAPPESSGSVTSGRAANESLDQMLARVFGDDPMPAIANGARVVAPVAASARSAAAAPAPAAPATHQPPPFSSASISSAPPPTASLAVASDRAGLDDLFAPGEMWQGGQPKAAPKRAAGARAARTTLLDRAELEGALKLFDEGVPPAK